MSDSVRPHRWQPTRLPRPWDSPGKNTGVGSLSLLRGIFRPGNRTWGSCIAGGFFTDRATREAWWYLVFTNQFFLSYHSQKCPHLGLTVSSEFSFACTTEFSVSLSLTHRILFNPMRVNLGPPGSSHPCLQQPFSSCAFRSAEQRPQWAGP